MHMATSSMHERTSILLYDVVPPIPTAEDLKGRVCAKRDEIAERLEPITDAAAEILEGMGAPGRGIKMAARGLASLFKSKKKYTKKGRVK